MNDPLPLAYFEQLTRYLEQQAARVETLEQEVEQLRRTLEQMREKPAIHVDRIEYKFDQLKIETLEGSLQVGIAPETAKSLEQFILNENSLPLSADDTGDAAATKAVEEGSDLVEAYLEGEAAEYIRSLAEQYGTEMDDDYAELMIRDIRRQVAGRLEHYANSGRLSSAGGFNTGEEIAAKVIGDIRTAIEQHVKALRK